MARNKKLTKNESATATTTRRGFTLVEVIVVAVIVLILSAVAIPMYNGYVMQARQDAVDNLAETAAAAANSYWRKTGKDVMNADLAATTGTLKLHYSTDANKGHTVTVDTDEAFIKVEENKTGENATKLSKSVQYRQ